MSQTDTPIDDAEPTTDTENGYGLISARDADGEPRTDDHEFEWGDEVVKIKLRPPTLGEIQEYENLGDDVDAGRLADIIGRHIVKPEYDDPMDMTLEELNCYVNGIVSYAEESDAYQDELDERAAEGPGN